MSDSLQPHGLQHARPACPTPTPGVYSNSCPLSRWCHPTISSSVIPFSFCPQSFPTSGSFPKSQLFASGGQSIGVSASSSVLPMNIQDWFPLAWTGQIWRGYGQDQTVSPIILAFRILSVAEYIVFPSYWITSLTKEDIPAHCHVTSSVSLMVHYYIVPPHY